MACGLPHERKEHRSVIGLRVECRSSFRHPSVANRPDSGTTEESVVTSFPGRNVCRDFRVRLHHWRHCHGVECRHIPRRSGNHFHHPRRRLWRGTHDGDISFEGTDRVSKARFNGTTIAGPSHPALHGGGSAAEAAIATSRHCARTATATAGERNPGASRTAGGRKGRHQEG